MERTLLRATLREFAREALPEDDFRLIFDEYHPRLKRFFSVKSGCSPEDAEDLTLEVFGRVYPQQGKLHEIAEIEQFEAWLFTVATRVFLNWLRSLNAVRRRHVEESLDAEADPSRLLAQAALTGQWPEQDPLAACLARDQIEAVAKALRTLPERMRCCVVHYYGHERSVKEIAEIMGIEVNTVKSQLHQARSRLRELLGERFDAFEAKDPGS